MVISSTSRSLFSISAALAVCLAGMHPHAVRANVYATNVRLNGGFTNVNAPLGGTNVTISYLLNELADAGVTISIRSGNTLVRTISLPGGGAGTFQGINSVVWNGKDNASNSISSGAYSVSVTAAANGFFDWTQTSDDFNANNFVDRPRGIAVNCNTNSPYYGRVFVGNSLSVFNPLGIQKANADGSVAAEGATSTGGWAWGGNTNSPWKIEVSADDYVYVNDWSSNGVVLRFDQTISSTSRVVVLRGDNWPNAGTSRLSGPAITGTGTNTQIWMADVKSPGGVGISRWSVTTDGTVATNDFGTNFVQAGAGSDLSVFPYDVAVDASNRIYTVQFRTNSLDAAYRVMRFAGTNVAATNASWKIGSNDDNLRGAMGVAVNPAMTRVAVAFAGVKVGASPRVGGAVKVFNAASGVEIISLSPGGDHDHTDAAWDNVGNLYACDNRDGLWRVYSPPGSNAATTVSIAMVQVASPTPPVLSAPLSTNSQFQFTLTGQSNVSYVILSSPDLKTWTPELTNSGVPAVRTIVLPAPAAQSFYRALAQ